MKIEAVSYLNAILAASEDAILVKAFDGTIISWSHGAQAMYGYSAAEIVGQPITRLIPAGREIEAKTISDTIVDGEEVRQFETVRLTRDGRQIAVVVNAEPIRDANGQINAVLIITRYAGDRLRNSHSVQEMQTNAQHRAIILETANRVALDILASRSGIEALQHIAVAARVLANARYAALGVARPDGEGLSEFITVGLTPEEEAAIGPRPRGAGVLGLLLHRDEPLRLDDLSKHSEAIGFPPNHPPMHSFLGVPIRRGEVILGSLYLTDKQGGGTFTKADELAVQALGSHVAVAINHMQMLSRQRALVSGLMNAQEEERRAVAYDLHDGLTQYVMASHAHFESFRRAYTTGQNERAEKELNAGLNYLKEAVVESRRLVNGLRSLALDDLGLAGAIEQLMNEESARSAWQEVNLVQTIDTRRFDKALEVGAYRVVQEALTNVRKHAGARHVSVVLHPEPILHTGAEELRIEVRDDGCGFDTEISYTESGHVGLHGMAERVRLLGGKFEVHSQQSRGTTIIARFPIAIPASEKITADDSL